MDGGLLCIPYTAKLRGWNTSIEVMPWNRCPTFLVHLDGASNTVLKNLLHIEGLRNEE